MRQPRTAASPPRPSWRWVSGIFFLALIVRAALLYYRLNVEQIELRWLGGSDVPGWMGMARHLANGIDLSYWLMGARPPLYPAVAAAVFRLGGNLMSVAILQIVIGSLTAALGYLMSRRLMFSVSGMPSPEKPALISGIIVALDPASVSSSATLYSEPVFNLLFILFLFCMVRYLQQHRPLDMALSAGFMALAMMARPTAIYLWLAAPFMLILFVQQWWKPALALMAVGLAVYLGWSMRNLQYTGVFTYSLQTNFSLLFLRALSAEHIATGRSTDDLQVEYVRQLHESVGDIEKANVAAPDDLWEFLVPDSPELYREMGQMAQQKLLRYWPYTIATTGIGVVRLFGWSNKLPGWFRPIEIAYHAGLYSLVIWGLWQSFRRRDWLLLVSTLIPIMYISGLTLAAQTSAMDTRMRTSITAPLAVLAAYGFYQLWQARRVVRLSGAVQSEGV